MIGDELVSVVALILEKAAEKGLADFSPSLDDFGGAQCCTVVSVGFLVFLLFWLQMRVCGLEASNLLHLQDCKVDRLI